MLRVRRPRVIVAPATTPLRVAVDQGQRPFREEKAHLVSWNDDELQGILKNQLQIVSQPLVLLQLTHMPRVCQRFF